MPSVYVVGAGARLYKKLGISDRVVQEFRTNEIEKCIDVSSEDDLVIVFSLLDPYRLRNISKRAASNFVIVGSASALSPVAGRFKYSKFKREQLSTLKELSNPRIKYAIFGEFFVERPRKGRYYYSDPESFLADCWETACSKSVASDCFVIKGENTAATLLFGWIDRMAAPFSSLLLKKMTNFVYGYNRA
jgi:hypothetical protein